MDRITRLDLVSFATNVGTSEGLRYRVDHAGGDYALRIESGGAKKPADFGNVVMVGTTRECYAYLKGRIDGRSHALVPNMPESLRR